MHFKIHKISFLGLLFVKTACFYDSVNLSCIFYLNTSLYLSILQEYEPDLHLYYKCER